MNPRITDREVSELPVAAGRAELLEEIMRTPVQAPTPRRRSLPGWAMAVAASAAVAAIALVPMLRNQEPAPTPARPMAPSTVPSTDPSSEEPSASGGQDADEPEEVVSVESDPGRAAGAEMSDVPEVSDGTYVGLNAPGWRLTALTDGELGWSETFADARGSLDLTTYPLDQYDSYVQDRADLGAPTPVSVLGVQGVLVRYDSTDWEVFVRPIGGWFVGIRATGYDRAELEELLADLVRTDRDGFVGALPDGFVTPANRDQRVQELLRGVDLPPGFTAADVDLEGVHDLYSASATVAGSVACAWLDRWQVADADGRDQVEQILSGAERWPLLVAIADDGGYTDAVAEAARMLAVGHDDKGNPVDLDGLRQLIC